MLCLQQLLPFQALVDSGLSDRSSKPPCLPPVWWPLVRWEVEILRDAQCTQTDQATVSLTVYFLSDSVRSHLLQWGHSSRLTCHHVSARPYNSAFSASGGSQYPLTLEALSQLAPSVLEASSPLNLHLVSCAPCLSQIAPGLTSQWIP